MLQWFQAGCLNRSKPELIFIFALSLWSQNFHEETNYNDIHMGVKFILIKMFHVKQ